MSWEKPGKAIERGPISGAAAVIWIVLIIAILVVSAGIPLGWFKETARVAKEQYGPRASLEKYEWFVDQAQRIKKMDADVSIFEKRITSIDQSYAAYGEKVKWPPDVRIQYQSELQKAADDVVAMKSQRNTLVQEYNAQSKKFNWSPYKTRADKPEESFQE
jgi:hypothetical protein